MKTSIQLNANKVAFLAVLALVVLVLYGCATHQPEPTSTSESYNINRPPVEAPASVKASDFRLNPPVVEEMTFKKLTDDKELVAVRFAPDKRLGNTVTLNPNGEPIVLHDDGLNGDEQAGDHVYSAILPTEWESLAAEQDRLFVALENHKGPLQIPVFRGRELVGEQSVDVEELKRLRQEGIIKLPPFGTLANLDAGNYIDYESERVRPALLSGSQLQSIETNSLFITDPKVVNDTNLTYNPDKTGGNWTGTPMGHWTFGYLMTQMAGTNNPLDFVMNWIQSWSTNQNINGFGVLSRLDLAQDIFSAWPKNADGSLNLTNAPFKLSAIVNRIDLAANPAYGQVSGAEGRFIFTAPLHLKDGAFTVILEYGIPIHTCAGIQNWAQQWLALTNSPLNQSDYNQALAAITDQFTTNNADPSKPNGSALDQLRTDEFANDIEDNEGNWELREFQILTNDNQLHEVTVKQTPDYSFNQAAPNPGVDNSFLVSWINQNAVDIEDNVDTVPTNLSGWLSHVPFLGGSAFNTGQTGFSTGASQVFWNAIVNTPAINLEAARNQFSLNTCNGCHGAETQTGFLHVFDKLDGSEASLSEFLTGINVTNPFIVTVPLMVANTQPPGDFKTHPPIHEYNDLERRAQILTEDAYPSSFTIMMRNPVLLSSH
jgi:hypothetical protein